MTPVARRMPVALTIAGSDSSGGAGIQADLKTFTIFGVYGMSVLTAVTAQNTKGVRGVHVLPPAMVAQQCQAVLEDIRPQAVKTGMLATAAIVQVVAEHVRRFELPHLVVDPVMVSTSGTRLLDGAAVTVLREQLLPLASVLTPNVPEAEVLLGRSLEGATDEALVNAARDLCTIGPRSVLLKGGHRAGQEAVDILYDKADNTIYRFASPRVATRHTHGTGCTLAAAITAGLARGAPLAQAAESAHRYTAGAILHHPGLGRGRGPLDHTWAGLWRIGGTSRSEA